MKKSFIFLLLIVLLSACNTDDPAEIPGENPTPGIYDPAVHTLEQIELEGVQTLVLKKVEVAPAQSRIANQSVFERCDELGTLDNAVYEKIPVHGNQTPCFKNVHFWDGKPGTIFGQYRPSDSSLDVWFITDAAGKVHHLPKAPKKDAGFKNDKKIREYKGKPVYLTQEDFLATFDMTSDREETVIASRVGRFVVIPKNNGDHIVYTDLTGGKIRRPDGSIEDLSKSVFTEQGIRGAVNLTNNFYKNSSNDLTYKQSCCQSGYVNMIFDATGDILETAASGVPVALQEWLDGLGGEGGPPGCSLPYLGSCERDNNLLFCESHYSYGTVIKGFLLADSSQDIKEIKWWELGISGVNPAACLTRSFIWYAAGDILNKINKDLSASEEVLSGFNIYTLQCLDDNNLIIHGLNTDNFEYETFQLTITDDSSDNLRTMITENISEFIK